MESADNSQNAQFGLVMQINFKQTYFYFDFNKSYHGFKIWFEAYIDTSLLILLSLLTIFLPKIS